MTPFLPGALPYRLATVVGSMVVGALWQGVVLAALVALCLRVAHRTTATLRFALWTAALLLVCLLPVVEIAPASTAAAPLLHVDPRWSLALAAFWLTLSVVRAADLVRHALRLRTLSLRATPIAVNAEVAVLLSRHRDTQLCTSDRLDRPGVIGFFAPRILIPAWLFHQLTAAELEQIVLHELEHLRRRDDWLNLLQKLALVAFPLNPALDWIERRLCLERELACDEGVVRRTRAPRLYAACLARLAEHGLDHRSLTLALGFLERQSELARRVTGILRTSRNLSARQSLTLGGALAAVLFAGSVELARCPQLISFAAEPRSLATNAGARSVQHEVRSPSQTPQVVRYADAGAVPSLVRASLKQSGKPSRKAKLRHTHPSVAAQRAVAERPRPVELLATDLPQWPSDAAPVTPTLVRYRLVPVEGGWLLLQL